MSYVIVPTHVNDAIERRIAEFLETHPECEDDREYLNGLLLSTYNDTGKIADITKEG